MESIREQELDFLIRYPFLPEAKGIVENVVIDNNIMKIAFQRIESALKGTATKKVLLHETDKVNEIAGHAAARMILSYLKNSYLTNKYAVSESKRASGTLGYENDENLNRIADSFGINIKEEKEGKKLRAGMTTYLRFSPRSIDYKLIYREITGGWVTITKHEKIRMVEEAIRKKLERNIMVKNPPEAIKKTSEEIIALLPKIEPRMVTFKEGEHPPCIGNLIDSIKKHQNLPHQARWYLAVYLLNRGMDFEHIVSLYSNLPDYSEKITRYQLEYAKKKGYVVPSCATVISWGMGCANCSRKSPLEFSK